MQRHVAGFLVVRYGVAVVCVTIAAIVALWLRPVVLAGAQLLHLAVLVTGWVSGLGPALVAWALATLAFDYYFTAPFDSLKVQTTEVPRLVIFTLLAALLAIMSATRRRAEDSLKSAREELETRVRDRTAELQRSNERLHGAVAEAVTAEHRFRDLVDTVDGIVWEADATTFQFSFVSSQAERILGYPRQRWVSDPTFWEDHLHPADRSWVMRLCEKSAGDTRDQDLEYRMMAADGRVVWLRDQMSVVRDGDRPARLRGVMVDITERKQAEEERQARRWQVESMDRVNLAIHATNDLEQMMSDVLDAALSIFDCDRAWLVYPCDPEARAHGVRMQRTRPEFPGLFSLTAEVPVDAEAATVLRIARAANGPVTFGPGSDHPLSAQLAERLGVQSRILMAVYPKGDQPYMFGLSQCSYPRVWTSQERQLFQAIGRRLTDALTSLSMLRSLRESERRLEDAQRLAHVGHWERDVDTDVIAWSDETYRIFGLRPQERTFTSPQFFELVHVDDRQFVVEAATTLRSGGHYDVEYRVVRPSGEVRHVHSQGDLVRDDSGRPQRIFGIVQDITERKRAEYLTGHVFDIAPDAVYIVGRDYRYQRVNPTFERRWRLPAERLVGMRVDELAGTEPFEETYKPNFDRCFAGEEASFVGWFPTPAGRRYLSATYSPLRPDAKRVEAVLVISRDLTQHMLASEALNQAQAELAHVTRVTTLGELAASIAHEINQPLAAIVADANASLNWLAAAHPNLDMVRDALTAVVSDGHRAGNVIQRIRQLATKSDPQRARVEVNDLIREMLPLVRTEVRTHDVSLRLDLAPALPPVLGDRVQLQQVLINLVMNGIEAMASVPDRPRHMVIRSRPHEPDEVVVAVEDAGVGIDPKSVSQLFTAFFTTKPGGMGMGLSISRSIIEAHGGRLWATPNSTNGATFQFALPRMP
jgi:PAS domain S-box-containing protein